MNTLNIDEPRGTRLAAWLRHAAVGLIAMLVLASLVLSFAVEFMATGVDFHGRAQSLSSALDGQGGQSTQRMR